MTHRNRQVTHMHRTTTCALVALAALIATPRASDAQATQPPTQSVTVTIKIPFTLQRIYPEVTAVQFICMLYAASSPVNLTGMGPSAKIPLAGLSKAADGSMTGEATATGAVNVPVDAAGKGGSYRCLAYGDIGGVLHQFLPGNPTVGARSLATVAPAVEGTFTW